MEYLFSDLAPRFFDLEVMWTSELSKGPSLLLVVEKEKAVSEVQDLVGRFEIKNRNDFLKTKKK